MFFLFFCSIFTDYCFDLAPVANGNTTYNMNMLNEVLNNTRPNGTVFMVTCDNGYRLEGPGAGVCNIGNWTNETPTCVQSRFDIIIVAMRLLGHEGFKDSTKHLIITTIIIFIASSKSIIAATIYSIMLIDSPLVSYTI